MPTPNMFDVTNTKDTIHTLQYAAQRGILKIQILRLLCIFYQNIYLIGRNFVGRNFRRAKLFVTKRKIRHFRPTKSFAQ